VKPSKVYYVYNRALYPLQSILRKMLMSTKMLEDMMIDPIKPGESIVDARRKEMQITCCIRRIKKLQD